jgi:chemotaxis protein CheD
MVGQQGRFMQEFDQFPKVFLQTGDCFLGVRPTMVTTVLGSCVAVTMCEPSRGIGAICHAFLPDSASFTAGANREPQVCRFVDTALENMYSSMLKLRIAPERLVVKVFGGASGIMSGDRANLYDIGGRNLRAVKQWLMVHGMPVSKSQTGGSKGRKLHFLTHTGDVWIKLLNRSGQEE